MAATIRQRISRLNPHRVARSVQWRIGIRIAAAKRALAGAPDAVFPVAFAILLPLIAAASFYRLRLRGRPASLWGTTPILTLPLLVRADRALGFASQSVVHTTYYITDQFDFVLADWVERVSRSAPHLLPAFYRFVFLWSLLRFDVFHFFYDQGLLERSPRIGINGSELALLRRAGKRVYLYAYGADVRTQAETRALGTYNCCIHCDRVGSNCICDSEHATRNQAYYREYATALVATGDMMTYVPGAVNLWYWPVDTERLRYSGVAWDGSRPLRIFHAPNHPWAKGSDYLIRAIDQLRAEGLPIELLTVSKVSNTEVMRTMEGADVLVDQLLIGWHGYTALEGLAQGKVVVCFIRDPAMLREPVECPIISANPDTIEEVLRGLLERSPQELVQLGGRGRNYVEQHFSVAAVASRLGGLYHSTGRFPTATQRRLAIAMQLIVQGRSATAGSVGKPLPPGGVVDVEPQDEFAGSCSALEAASGLEEEHRC
jgi:hypothetical protein